MDMRPIEVCVPNRLIERCRDFGEQVVESYVAGQSERSRQCGVPERRIDLDPVAQWMGKLCEVAGCIAVGLNPDDDIRWHRHADDGWDFDLQGSLIDVKGSWQPGAKRLIWPKSKTHFFNEAAFGALMFVWAEGPNSPLLGSCEARGWISKEEFRQKKTEVQGPNPFGFEIGTWVLHERFLRPIHDLKALEEEFEPAQKARAAQDRSGARSGMTAAVWGFNDHTVGPAHMVEGSPKG